MYMDGFDWTTDGWVLQIITYICAEAHMCTYSCAYIHNNNYMANNYHIRLLNKEFVGIWGASLVHSPMGKVEYVKMIIQMSTIVRA